MRQFTNYGDSRQQGFCAFCGATAETAAKIPRELFLDHPYLDSASDVPACRNCAQSGLLDDQYLACLVECVLVGSTDLARVTRERVADIFSADPSLQARIANARQVAQGETQWTVEVESATAAVVRLAKAHALFELNEPQFEEPVRTAITPLVSMSDLERRAFETPPFPGLLPEVGSIALQRMVVSEAGANVPWIEVQPGRYRYLCAVDKGVLVRIVLSEYLACEVVW